MKRSFHSIKASHLDHHSAGHSERRSERPASGSSGLRHMGRPSARVLQSSVRRWHSQGRTTGSPMPRPAPSPIRGAFRTSSPRISEDHRPRVVFDPVSAKYMSVRDPKKSASRKPMTPGKLQKLQTLKKKEKFCSCVAGADLRSLLSSGRHAPDAMPIVGVCRSKQQAHSTSGRGYTTSDCKTYSLSKLKRLPKDTLRYALTVLSSDGPQKELVPGMMAMNKEKLAQEIFRRLPATVVSKRRAQKTNQRVNGRP